jgi:hypothetical protein
VSQSSLQREAEQTSYALRSSFFYRVHSLWPNLLQMLSLAAHLKVKWESRNELGISEAAWQRIRAQGISPVNVFCHPEVIKATPLLIAYYRCLALLPQKGAQRLAYGTKQFEDGKRSNLTERQAARLAQVFNGLVSLLIESDPKWSLERSRIAALLNLGTQVNGSWRNEIGAEGSRRVKELLISHFVQAGLITDASRIDGSKIEVAELAGVPEAPPIEVIRSFRTSAGYTFTFGNEPDISIRNADGVLVSTVEVKYGLDPAGALERYGAAKKSFEQATKEKRRVHNIYLASCITSEVRNRINEDRLVNEDFNLTEVLGDAEKRTQFLRHVEHLISL